MYEHDVMPAILVFQDNKTAAMLVYQTNPVGVQLFSYKYFIIYYYYLFYLLFSYVNTFFCSNKFVWLLVT